MDKKKSRRARSNRAMGKEDIDHEDELDQSHSRTQSQRDIEINKEHERKGGKM